VIGFSFNISVPQQLLWWGLSRYTIIFGSPVTMQGQEQRAMSQSQRMAMATLRVGVLVLMDHWSLMVDVVAAEAPAA
jgi:hypothetical protein